MFVFIFAPLNLSVPCIIWRCWAPTLGMLQNDRTVSWQGILSVLWSCLLLHSPGLFFCVLIRFAVKLDFNLAIISIIGADHSNITVINFGVDMWCRLCIFKTLIITALLYVLWVRFTMYHFSEQITFVYCLKQWNTWFFVCFWTAPSKSDCPIINVWMVMINEVDRMLECWLLHFM